MVARIVQVDLKDPPVLQEITAYLAPHEKQSLFLTGNLHSELDTVFYAAFEQKAVVGVCAYYPLFSSCSLYTTSDAVSRSFGKLMEERHKPRTLLGMASMAKPAFEEWVRLGRVPAREPESLFYELPKEAFRPFHVAEGFCGPIEEKDIEDACLLLRQLRAEPDPSPVTDSERARMAATSIKFGLKVGDKVVSMAMSNGVGMRVFQILGVATDPAFRQRGFARAVCSALITHLFDKGADTAIIFTGETNIAARRCYEGLGFKATDRYYVADFT